MLLPLTTALLTAQLALQASIEVSPPRWAYRHDKVALTVSLSNPSDRPVTVLLGHAGSPHYFISLRLVNQAGKVLWSGEDPRFIDTDDLPMGAFATLLPHGSYRAVLDWRILYNLAPGTYSLSAVFRVEPESEPNAAAYYAGEIKAHHAWTGRVASSAVSVVVTASGSGKTP